MSVESVDRNVYVTRATMVELLGSVRPTGRETAVPKGPKGSALTPGPRASLQATVSWP